MEGFTVAGNDRKFYPAEAVIKGKNLIVVSDSVAAPVAVRYGWRNLMPASRLLRSEQIIGNQRTKNDEK